MIYDNGMRISSVFVGIGVGNKIKLDVVIALGRVYFSSCFCFCSLGRRSWVILWFLFVLLLWYVGFCVGLRFFSAKTVGTVECLVGGIQGFVVEEVVLLSVVVD